VPHHFSQEVPSRRAGIRLWTSRSPGVGIDERARPFRYAVPTPITERELGLLRAVVERVRPAGDRDDRKHSTPAPEWQGVRIPPFLFAVPLIWGGYDPTVNPWDCLDYCDYACIGAGDTAILDLAACIDQSRSLDKVPNLAWRRCGHVAFNRPAPLTSDLDSLPWRDNTAENKYLIDDDRLVESYPGLSNLPAGIRP